MAPGLSTDLTSPESIPYFLWDEPMTVAEVKERLRADSESTRLRMLGKIMREARDTDVWVFTTPKEVVELWPKLEPFLGRRRDFWNFILSGWRELGLIA
jgi:hypothetical protein